MHGSSTGRWATSACRTTWRPTRSRSVPVPRGLPRGRRQWPGDEGAVGAAAEELPDDHPAWALEAHYLAHALAIFVCVLSPQRIVLGGA